MSTGKPKPRPAPIISRKGRWSHAEIERVKRWFGSESEAAIAKRLKRPVASVRRIILKIYDQAERRSGPWAPSEIMELKQLFGRAKLPVIARKLRRTPKDVEHRLTLLRGQIRPRAWSSQDEQELKSYYGSRSDADLTVILGRPVQQIEEKAQQLCLAKDKSFQHRAQGVQRVRMPRWSDEELKTLIRLYPNTPNIEIARVLQRSNKSVVSKANDLELRKSSDRLRRMGQENVSLRHGRAPSESEDRETERESGAPS